MQIILAPNEVVVVAIPGGFHHFILETPGGKEYSKSFEEMVEGLRKYYEVKEDPVVEGLFKAMGEVQDLAGRAKAIYQNDRDTFQADKLIPVLDEIFQIAVNMRSLRRPDDI